MQIFPCGGGSCTRPLMKAQDVGRGGEKDEREDEELVGPMKGHQYTSSDFCSVFV